MGFCSCLLLQVFPWKLCPGKIVKNELKGSLRRVRTDWSVKARNGYDGDGALKQTFLVQPFCSLSRNFSAKFGSFLLSYRCVPVLSKRNSGPNKKINYSGEIGQKLYVPFVRVAVAVMLVMSLSVAITRSPSSELSYFVSFCELSMTITCIQ